MHIKRYRSRISPKSHQHAPQRKPPDTTILDTFATSNRFSTKRVMTTPFYFLCLLWGPFGSSRSLGKIPTFGPATPTGRPNPAKPVLLLGGDPKSFCKFFPQFLRSPLCGLLRKIFKQIGIHQRLFEETNFTASILPRRSGRSPLQYAAAFSPKMPLKGAVEYG